jgi:predicted ribonuclease YlaK
LNSHSVQDTRLLRDPHLPIPTYAQHRIRTRNANGFNYIVSKFGGESVAAHVELQKGERSELAELAANLL